MEYLMQDMLLSSYRLHNFLREHILLLVTAGSGQATTLSCQMERGSDAMPQKIDIEDIELSIYVGKYYLDSIAENRHL